MDKKDPYKYFRIEARELSDALNKEVLELEKTDQPMEVIARLLRYAHTLKGASRVMKLPAIADIAHGIEGIVSPFRDSQASIPSAIPNQVLALLDALSLRLTDLEQASAQSSSGNHALEESKSKEEKFPPIRKWDTVRLEVADVDAVLEKMSEVTTQIALLRQEMSGLIRIRRLSTQLGDRGGFDSQLKTLSIMEEINSRLDRFNRVSVEALDQAERDLRQAHERTERLRLLPAASLFDFLERTVRDAAGAMGKQVRFEAAGGDQRMDAPVLSSLQEAMLHIVRNAVAHGIETPKARALAGKPTEGVVRIEVGRRAGKVSFSCRDDGRGIDAAEISRLAKAKGLLPDTVGRLPDMQEAVKILLHGGISTAEKLTELSGRGIGLDVVRETVEGLRGEVRVESQPGKGTRVLIEVPYSMSTFATLAVEADGESILIPFECVKRAVRLLEAEVARSPEGDTVLFDGHAIPLLPLEGVFSRNQVQIRAHRPGVVVESAAGMAMVGVDRIIGVQETVSRPLPALAVSDGLLSGASLDVNGNPCLVLDPEGLIDKARFRRGAKSIRSEAVERIILIVDDSLTTRMLEQSILESAGYTVDLAVSGEEALIKARQKSYSLFLVDVEMPGMDGFQLLDHFRSDAGLRNIPAILVTSRSSREDRRRGESVGARDHIVKGEFDQARLIARIKELIG